MAKPRTQFIRPTVTDVGRGPEKHRLRFQRRHLRGSIWYELPAEGGAVPWHGREGHHWQQRLAEGAVETCAPAKTKRVPKGEG